MDIGWNSELVDQLEWHWQHQLRPRLDGLTDDEYFWRPVPGCWTISRRGESSVPISRRDGRPGIGSICCGVVDDDATGLGRGEESPPPAGGPEAPPAGVNRWILVAVVFLGAVVAIGGVWVAGRDAQTPIHGLTPPASSRAVDGPNRRVVAELCHQPFSADPDGISPDSPEITDITAIDRTTVRVRWVDRSPYSDTIIIVARVCENGRMINAYFGTRATEHVFRGLDPATAPWCFRVEAITNSDLYSHQRCISPPG